ncbi:MAG: FYDLN acid domain-containing protein [Hyphomicrobiaceae bacterium]
MATKKVRGTKRTCQNGDCGVRFYDLERDPIICPMCESEYVVAHSPAATLKNEPKPEPIVEKKSDDEDPVEEELVDAEADAVVGDDDANDKDAFLEEEEDNSNVSDIIGTDKPGKAVE